jgi:pimeloyl-ACP methyl ester carboxylesterase
VFYSFFNGFIKYPEATMQHLVAMSASGDENADLVFDKMKIQDLNVLSCYALEQQLLHLRDFSCFDVNFKKFPKTICFTGANDAIVASSQAELFADIYLRIKNFELHIIKNCGHAPHFSHMEEIKERLKNVI